MQINGTIINYYFVCKRKLWIFLHNINFESQNSNVELGRLINENAYSNKKKNLVINNEICVDFLENYNVIHEVKKTPSIEESSIWQIKYYIYYFKLHGVLVKKGIIDYPTLRKRKEVFFESGDTEKIIKIINDIDRIKKSKIPPLVKRKMCKKCAYYEFCYI
jgi:CRISPR-associated exonuclease Cas4